MQRKETIGDKCGLPAVLDVTDPARVTYREVADLTLPSWASQ